MLHKVKLLVWYSFKCSPRRRESGSLNRRIKLNREISCRVIAVLTDCTTQLNRLTWRARTAAHMQMDLWTHHLLAYNTCAHITSPTRDQMVGLSYGAVERWGHRSSSKGFSLPSWAFSMRNKGAQPRHMRLCGGERWTQRKDTSTGSGWECENTETQLPTVEPHCKVYRMP